MLSKLVVLMSVLGLTVVSLSRVPVLAEGSAADSTQDQASMVEGTRSGEVRSFESREVAGGEMLSNSLDLSAIRLGSYEGLAGKWQAGDGQLLVITSEGQVVYGGNADLFAWLDGVIEETSGRLVLKLRKASAEELTSSSQVLVVVSDALLPTGQANGGFGLAQVYLLLEPALPNASQGPFYRLEKQAPQVIIDNPHNEQSEPISEPSANAQVPEPLPLEAIEAEEGLAEREEEVGDTLSQSQDASGQEELLEESGMASSDALEVPVEGHLEDFDPGDTADLIPLQEEEKEQAPASDPPASFPVALEASGVEFSGDEISKHSLKQDIKSSKQASEQPVRSTSRTEGQASQPLPKATGSTSQNSQASSQLSVSKPAPRSKPTTSSGQLLPKSPVRSPQSSAPGPAGRQSPTKQEQARPLTQRQPIAKQKKGELPKTGERISLVLIGLGLVSLLLTLVVKKGQAN